MKLVQIFVVLLFQECVAYFYPALFWHKDNCGFQQWKTETNGTKEYFIKVVPNNGMNIVCPNQVTINNWLTDAGISSPSLIENMWLVDKHGYDKCLVNTNIKYNKQILLCDKPREIKYKPFLFHPRFNFEEPRFAPGQHYYFISTSRGFKTELSTRKVSGSDGNCEKYHMKLHIYVCDPKKEDCIWQIPHCGPPLQLHRDMLMINGKLPAPTYQTITTKSTTPEISTPRQPVVYKEERTQHSSPKQCPKKEKRVSIHLILNFVLGGVALFMMVVIVILACGLTKKSKEYKPQRPPSTSSSVHEPNKNAYIETLRYTDVPSGLYRADHQLPSGYRPAPGTPLSNYLILQQDAHYNMRTPQSYDVPYSSRVYQSVPQKMPQSSDGRVFTFPDIERKPSVIRTSRNNMDIETV